MIESLGLAGAVFLALAWYNMLAVAAVVFIFTLCVFYEVTEGSAIFLAITIFVLNYFGIIALGNLEWSTIIYGVIAYLAIGCVWSLFKYKQKAKMIAVYNRINHPRQTLEDTYKEIKRTIANSEISFWIVFFPISMIKFALSDFVYYLISKLGRVYDYIARYVVDSVFKDSEVKSKEVKSKEVKKPEKE